MALIWLLLAGQALAQTGIRLSTSVEGLAPPETWYAVIPGTRQARGERSSGWGLMPTPPGDYEVMLIPEGQYSVPVSFGRVTVAPGRITDVEIASAIRFEPNGSQPPPDYWRVLDARGEVVAQVVESWGVAAVPPGQYRLETGVPGGEVRSPLTTVSDGSVARLGSADLGIAHLEAGLPDEQEVGFLFGGEELLALLQIGDDYYDLGKLERDDRGTVGLWMKAEDTAVELVHGSFIERTALDLQPGATAVVPFDPDALAQARGYAVLEFEAPPGASVSADRVVVLAAGGSRALLSDPAFDFDKIYLAPGLSTMTVTVGDAVTRLGPFPSGQRTRIDSGRFQPGPTDVPVPVSIVIETPASGTAIPAGTDEIRLVGDASAAGAAGTTKIALVVDVSASTGESSGTDVDGDGQHDSVLQAEVAAADALLDQLAALEAQSPGTAYSVALIAFGETAQVLMPLTSLASADAVTSLRNTLSGLTHAMQGADTFYDRGIDAALRLLERSELPGPAAVIFVTDGKPSQVAPGIDAAARLGEAGAQFHSIGLGSDFRGARAPGLRFPPLPDTGPEILASLSAFGAKGGRVWLLPDPADVVSIVSELPIVERVDAGIASVAVRNETTGEDALEVGLSEDGSFEARVPVGLDQAGGIIVNLLSARAIASGAGHDGEDRSAEATVLVVAEGGPEQLAVARGREREALDRQITALSDQAARRALAAEKAQAESARLRSELEAAKAAVGRLRAQEAEAGATADRMARELAETRAGLESRKSALAAERERRIDAESGRAAAEANLAEARQALEAAASADDLDACRAEARQCRGELIEALNAAVPAQPGADSIVLSFPGDVLFSFAASDIRPDAEATLRLAALYIRENKRTDVIIEGHTDGIGSSETNKALSLARAEAVQAWLIGNGVVASEQVRAVGLGEEQPLEVETRPDGSDNPEARQRNRRVEIRLLQ